jgi:hypothetical protein
MSCYYQGCSLYGNTKEHIPPKSFFPKDQRNQLLTVTSCQLHNNAKSLDDTYVLAHICMNASPSNRSREIFRQRVFPQLGYNGEALKKTLARDAVVLSSGAVHYKVDTARFDKFFDALSYGIVFKACGESLPAAYRTKHVYHNFKNKEETSKERALKKMLLAVYSGEPLAVLSFGPVSAQNTSVYSVKVFGIAGFKSSLTVIHDFFGAFRVTTLLSKQVELTRFS